MCPLFALGGAAHATPVTFRVTGMVDTVYVNDPALVNFDGSVALGSPYSATFTVDPDSSDALPFDLNQGVYPLLGYSASLGLYGFAPSVNTQVVVDNDVIAIGPIDHFTVFDLSPVVSGSLFVAGSLIPAQGAAGLQPFIQLFDQFDFNASFLDGDGQILPDLARFPTRFNVGFFVGAGLASASGPIDTLTIIPEPSTVALVACGATLLAQTRRLGRRRIRAI